MNGMRTAMVVGPVLLVTGLVLAAAPAKAPEAAGPAMAAEGRWHLSPLLVKDVKEVKAYQHGSRQATMANIKEAIEKTFAPVMEAVSAKKISPEGPAIFVYRGLGDAPDQEFTLETGFAVAADAKPAGELKIKALPAYRAATAYYTGAVQGMPEAAHKLYEEVVKAGLQPSGEYREVYLFWEGPESVNNVVEIQVAVGK